MNIIKKHPAAFWFFAGIELMGISGLLAASEKAEESEWCIALVGLLGAGGAAVVLLTALVCLAVRLIKSKKEKPVDTSKRFIDGLALEYMSKSKFVSIYWVIVILMTPVIPVLLVWVLDLYTAGVMVTNLGIMILMLVIYKDVVLARFYRVKKTDSRIALRSGEDGALLDALYGDYVHVYRTAFWERESSFICSLMEHEKVSAAPLECYQVSNEFLNSHFGFEYPAHYDGLVLVPFSQFRGEKENLRVMRRMSDSLSFIRFTDLVNVKYSYFYKDSTDPSDYAHSGEGIMLQPRFSVIKRMERRGEDVFVSMDTARGEEKVSDRYYTVLLAIRGAEFLTGDALLEEKQLKSGYSDSFDAFACDEAAKTVSFTVGRIEKIDGEADGEEACYEEDDYMESEETPVDFSYRFERLEWYWDGFCNTEKTERIFAGLKD